MGFGIIQGVDVLITPEAQREIEALRAVRPASSIWGILIGHKRGFRFFVEKVFPVAGAASAPSEREIASIDSVWSGRTIGLFAVRPSPAFRKALLGPMLYGKLFLRLETPAGKGSARPFVIEFERRFFFAKIPLVTAGKAKAHE
ncbi:MAG: hypothetical protein MUQ25_01835 [Candidatus Aminicenantes bacterium]|nr:hypothetical protein [Candidatus Aminicenantes bacterium]